MTPPSRLIIVLLSSLMISCAHHSPVYWGAGEWVAPKTAAAERVQSAGIDWSKLPGVITSIDGQNVGNGFKQGKLPPGKHVIEYVYHTAEFGAHPKGSFELTVEAGHAYQFNLKLCFWCHPRRFAVWVDDQTTGALVWGQRPDWPSWWL